MDTPKADPDKNDSLNEGFTAIPKGRADEQTETAMESTPANEEDARELGYTDQDGHAVEKARPDTKGSPTGALTDIGAGRSSVIKHTGLEPH